MVREEKKNELTRGGVLLCKSERVGWPRWVDYCVVFSRLIGFRVMINGKKTSGANDYRQIMAV